MYNSAVCVSRDFSGYTARKNCSSKSNKSREKRKIAPLREILLIATAAISMERTLVAREQIRGISVRRPRGEPRRRLKLVLDSDARLHSSATAMRHRDVSIVGANIRRFVSTCHARFHSRSHERAELSHEIRARSLVRSGVARCYEPDASRAPDTVRVAAG